MIPVNRIKRWPFPGKTLFTTLWETPKGRTQGEGSMTFYRAITLALGDHEGKKFFDYIKQFAMDAAERMGGGVPCIFFDDPMGEFIGLCEEVPEPDSDDGLTLEPGDDPDADETLE